MISPALIIIGERINSSRRSIARAIEDKDETLIQNEARMQRDAGADYIDVNAGTFMKNEEEYLPWLVRTVQAAVDTPLSLDSPNPAALSAALREHRGTAMINSITLEPKRMDSILPLVLEHNCAVIAQAVDSVEVPADAEKKVEIAVRLIDALTAAGVPPEKIFIDPIVQPLGMVPEASPATLGAFSALRARRPDVHLLCGVGNISFKLPHRLALDSMFLGMAMAAGADAAIIDPCNDDIMMSVAAAEALLGRDEFCMRYIAAHRDGRFGTEKSRLK
jgi:5-methyltetrahydrofolate--homocysteine methyltransferase